ncbi:hypothetical protein HanIR_Chr10g0476111 [Helianthus annuus]|nr:hypothetical protein HanIR_Chr10g0476111 [Helianthus annuus]
MKNRKNFKPLKILRINHWIKKSPSTMSTPQHQDGAWSHVLLQMLHHFNLLFNIHPHKCSHKHHIILLQFIRYIQYITCVKYHPL